MHDEDLGAHFAVKQASAERAADEALEHARRSEARAAQRPAWWRRRVVGSLFVVSLLAVPWRIDGGRIVYSPGFLSPSAAWAIADVLAGSPQDRELFQPTAQRPLLELVAFEWAAIAGLALLMGWRPAPARKLWLQ